MPSNQQPAPVDFHLPQRRACAAVGTLLPQWHDGRPPAALQILPAALVSSFAFGSELLASAGWLHDGVLSFRLMGLMMGLPYANSLGAAGSLLMLPKDSKVTRGSEQLRSIFYDVMGVLVYVLLVSSVEFVLLLGADSALYYRAIGIAAFTSFQLLVADFDPDCQNATVATVVFVVTICLVIIVLLNMLIGTWPLKQSERALLGLRGGAQLLNEFEARVSSKASARADWFPKWLHEISEVPTQAGTDRTAAALQLQVMVQGRTRMINASPNTTAVQLEHMVAERVGINDFGLYYRSRPLHGSTALSNYGLTSGVTIELKERGRGGGCSKSKSSTVDTEDHVPAVEARKTSHITQAVRSISARKVIQGKLAPYNFESLWAEKRASHLQGTREWAFEEIEQWRKDESASKLFWLMGGGGVGKSVLSAELLARWLDKRCVAAWHFCRHDDIEQSKPANLLRSIAAMLCHTLDGFEEALSGATGLEDALLSADPRVVFDVLIQQPLEKVPSQTTARVIMVDALDEIPKEGHKPLLDVIVNQLASLPGWLRVFVTSREEPLIQKALSAFRPKELRADEAKNRADVEVFLRTIAREHVKGQANMSDVAKAVERQFKIKLPLEALSSMQEKMDESRAIYDLAARKLRIDPKLRELEQVNEMREPKPRQQSSEFETIYGWAERAQKVLEESVASEWEEDLALKGLKHPKSEAKKSWVSKADSPGVKGKDRAAEKCQNDYDGDAAHLKDVARLTLLFDSFQRMIDGLEALRNNCGFKVVALKNKFAHPTPMGYRDLNLCVEVPIDKETRFICEVQINHSVMIEAKAKAHKPYEHIRSELPKLCKGTGVNADKLEAFIVGQLNSSALDVAVSALSAKAQGLFLYAFMLQQYLDNEAKANRTISFHNLDTLPAGLDDVYAVNFRRAFPADAPEREALSQLLQEIFREHKHSDGVDSLLCVQRMGGAKWVRTDAWTPESLHMKYFSAADILSDLDFVLDNTFVTFGDAVYRQQLGVPMGFACSPMVAVLMLCFYELRMLRSLVRTADTPGRVESPWGLIPTARGGRERLLGLAARLSRCARAIDDILFLDITIDERDWIVKRMYPPALELKEVCRSPGRIFYLDTEIRRDRAGFYTTLYDKREALASAGLMGQVRKWPHVSSVLSTRCKYGTITSFMHRAFRVETRVRHYVRAVVRRIVEMCDDGYSVQQLLRYARRFARAHYTPRCRARGVHAQVVRRVKEHTQGRTTTAAARARRRRTPEQRDGDRRVEDAGAEDGEGGADAPRLRLQRPATRRMLQAATSGTAGERAGP
ncbi:hypothetical protein AB1Y20_000142 [Prymnesium parvum]|uniref:Ubiquitin-like domain-containing protein n=1 Tax=Prymnesium parvum TaxID=97485 RepID=A0AB34K7L3_PRYPA